MLRPEANRAGSLPVQADKIERRWSASDGPAAHGQVPGDEARRGYRDPRRDEEQNECGTK